MGGRRLGVEELEVEVGWEGRRGGGRLGEWEGHRLGAGHRRRAPPSSSWTAGSGSPLLTCRSWW